MTKLVDLYEGSVTNDETGWFIWRSDNNDDGTNGYRMDTVWYLLIISCNDCVNYTPF